MTAQEANPQQRQAFVPPALRMFEVTRANPYFIPAHAAVVTQWTDDGAPIDPRTDAEKQKLLVEHIVAQAIQHTGKGQVLLFLDFINDPNMGPMQKLTRIINGYIEVREVSMPERSNLIL